MLKSLHLSTLFFALAFTFGLGAGLAQAAYINADTVIYAYPPGYTFATGYDNRGDLTATSATTDETAMTVAGGFANSGAITAEGTLGGAGIALWTGDFTQSDGTLNATGGTAGTGIFIDAGSFFQSGGATIVTSNGPASRGFHLWEGDFIQSGGAVTAMANGGRAIYLDEGDFSQLGGAITATGENYGYGIYLDTGDFTQEDGKITTKGSGAQSSGIFLDEGDFSQHGGVITAMGENYGSGIRLTSGAFTQEGGAITAVGNGGAGIYLPGLSASFTQKGGSITAAGSGSQSRGIVLDEGDFSQYGGTLTATGQNSGSGIRLNNGDFRQHGGSITATGNDSSGIELASGSFTQEGGTLTATGMGGSRGYGIFYLSSNASFTQRGGSIIATGNNGYGIYLPGSTASFIQEGGTITAKGGNYGYGIFITVGPFTQGPAGVLRLLPGDDSGYALYLSGGNFIASGELQPGVDLASGIIGNIDARDATINPGAKLTPYLINSLALDKGDRTAGLRFMRTTLGTIIGAYPDPADTMTMHYEIEKTNNDKNYVLTIERTANVSDVVSGANNSRLARSLERNEPWLAANFDNPDAPAAAKLVAAYSLMDMSYSQGELDDKARAMTGAGAMRLPLQALYNMDQAATSLSDHMGAFARSAFKGLRLGSSDSAALDGAAAPAAGEASTDRLWTAWVAPLMRFDSYDAMTSDFTDLDGTYLGVSAGAARRFDAGTLGFAAHFIHGDLDGSGYDFTTNTVGVNAAFRTAPLDLAASFTPWAEIAVGYAYSDIDQDRDDIFGTNNNSDIDQHAFRAGLAFGHDFYVANDALRLTPIIGLDYTYISQSDYSEDGSPFGLPLDVDSTNLNSLRGRIGAELEYYFAERWAVDARAFYRYEFLDTYADTSASFQGTPIAFDLEGEDYDPSSGQLGAGLSFDATEDITLSAGYDFIFGDHYQGHNIEAAFRWEF